MITLSLAEQRDKKEKGKGAFEVNKMGDAGNTAVMSGH